MALTIDFDCLDCGSPLRARISRLMLSEIGVTGEWIGVDETDEKNGKVAAAKKQAAELGRGWVDTLKNEVCPFCGCVPPDKQFRDGLAKMRPALQKQIDESSEFGWSTTITPPPKI